MPLICSNIILDKKKKKPVPAKLSEVIIPIIYMCVCEDVLKQLTVLNDI